MGPADTILDMLLVGHLACDHRAVQVIQFEQLLYQRGDAVIMFRDDDQNGDCHMSIIDYIPLCNQLYHVIFPILGLSGFSIRVHHSL